MRVHKETIDVLIDLYLRCRKVFEAEYDAKHEGSDALEAAATDYMVCPERIEFCCVVDDLEHEVRLELIALMCIGDPSNDSSPADFAALKKGAVKYTNVGNYLIDQVGLPEHWRAALDAITPS
jgi:hypothetical protein